MPSPDYLAPFVEVGRALCDGVDTNSVMNLIARRTVETLELSGCFIKMKTAEGSRLELLSSYGLKEDFLFSESSTSHDSVCFQLPKELLCLHLPQQVDRVPEEESMMIQGIRSAAFIPIEVEQEALAMVALFSNAHREFTRTELNFAEALVARGILTFKWQRKVDSLVEEERRYLQSFQELSSAINSTLNIGKVLEMVVKMVTQVLHGKGCTVRLLDPKTQNLYVAQSFGLSKEFIEKGPVHSQRSIADNMAGKIVIIDDVFTDPRLQYPAAVAEEGIRKVLSIPLMVRSKVIGVLRFMTGDRPPFTKREINFATAIAQQCAFAIENARMYQRLKVEYQQMLIDFGYDGSSS
ncbi:MAG: GAF domain-containing protein [Syntrophobacteraceae bacterium]